MDTLVGSSEGSQGARRRGGGLSWQGVARPGHWRAGWLRAQRRGLLGWGPEPWSYGVGRFALYEFFLALLWSGGCP